MHNELFKTNSIVYAQIIVPMNQYDQYYFSYHNPVT